MCVFCCCCFSFVCTIVVCPISISARDVTSKPFLWSWTWFSSGDCFPCIHLLKWFIRNCHPLGSRPVLIFFFLCLFCLSLFLFLMIYLQFKRHRSTHFPFIIFSFGCFCHQVDVFHGKTVYFPRLYSLLLCSHHVTVSFSLAGVVVRCHGIAWCLRIHFTLLSHWKMARKTAHENLIWLSESQSELKVFR